MRCSSGISFANSPPLIVQSNTNVTIQCPSLLRINLFSNSGTVLVDKGAYLTFQGCDVFTIASRGLATAADPPPRVSVGYFEDSAGVVRFVDSRYILSSAVWPQIPNFKSFQKVLHFLFYCNCMRAHTCRKMLTSYVLLCFLQCMSDRIAGCCSAL